MKNLCERAWLDGFMRLSVGRVVTECGIAATEVAEIVAHLADANLIRLRCDDTGTPIIEPRPVLYALVQWLATADGLAA